MAIVLLVGGGLQAISSARSLKEAGHKVGIISSTSDYSQKSSALSFKKKLGCKLDIVQLQTFIKEHNVEVVIPMSDKYALLLSENKETILKNTGCQVATPHYDIIKAAADKLSLMDLCEKYDLPHPRTIQADIESISLNNELEFPVLIKPNHSVGARGITKVSNKEELYRKLPIIENNFGKCHIQEYIGGNMPYFNVMLYRNKEGICVNYVILEIIRYYPINGGSSSMCRTIKNRSLVEICMKTLDALNYQGFADFDILQTEKGDYKIIEINPRVPASLRGAAISGINFPAIMVADTLGMSIPTYHYNPGKILRYLGLDIMWFFSSTERFKTKPSWFKFWGRNVFYQEGGFKDLKPMLVSLFSNFNKLEFKSGRFRKKSQI